MAVFLTPSEVTPGSANAWTDVDVSASVPSGATGVILHVVNNAFGYTAAGVRKNGSTDNRTGTINPTSHSWCAVGVDSSRIFECYVGSTTEIDVYLVGYFTTDAVFFDNAVDKSLSSTGSWIDIDISSDTGGDTAIGAIFEVTSSVQNTFGLRKNGSTDNRNAETSGHTTTGALIGVDGSEICEGQVADVGTDFFLVGYIKSGATFNTNATDVSLGTRWSWLDLTALTSGAIGGIYEAVAGAGTNFPYGFRKNGSSEAIAYSMEAHPWAIIECDGSYLVEGYIEDLTQDFFEIGYFTAVAGGGGLSIPVAMNQYRQRWR